MADDLWRKERTRLYLLSYNELLYFLKKYPKSSPYKLTKDVSTQTSPHLFKQTHNNKINDTCVSISPTIILSPSPHTKHKRQYNNINNTSIPIKTMHKSAIKVSDSLFNNLINNNTLNNTSNDIDSENETQNNNKINRKRTYTQSIEYNTDNNINININKDNQPLKRRKIFKKCDNKNKNKILKPKLFRCNNNNIININNKKIIKPKLFRCSNNNISLLTTNVNNSYESIESTSPIHYKQFKTKTPKKSKGKMSIISQHENSIETVGKTVHKHRNKKSKRRRRSSLVLHETCDENNDMNLNENIFGLLPELDEQNAIIKSNDCEEKEMSNGLYNSNEMKWKYNNESIPIDNISPIKSSYESNDNIIEKYTKDVNCFGGNVNGNINICNEDNSEGKVSLFDNTNFSDEQMKVNSLLNDNEIIENENGMSNVNNNYNGKHKYSVFEFPQ